MGCGSSKNNSRPQSGGGNGTDSQTVTNLDLKLPVIPFPQHYPAPRPPITSRDEIYERSAYFNIDELARFAPSNLNSSYKKLVEFFSPMCRTELQKLRAVFIWLAYRNFMGEIRGQPHPDTPTGYMVRIQEGKGDIPGFFALLCRHAGIPCVVIDGVAKSVSYEVGDKEDVFRLRNRWNAVYVAGSWRFVHPIWAVVAAEGENSDKWTLVESKGTRMNQREKAVGLKPVQYVNDYYFLIEPEHLIVDCFPDREEWQLLENPYTRSEFVSIPHYQPQFFLLGLKHISEKTGVLKTKEGRIETSFFNNRVNVSVSYKLFFRNVEEGKDDDNKKWNRYVFMTNCGNEVHFHLMLPKAGLYKLAILADEDIIADIIACEFLVECDRAADVHPLPASPDIGWGPGKPLKRAAIVAISHREGKIETVSSDPIVIKFKSRKKFEYKAVLVANGVDPDTLNDCSSVTVKEGEVFVNVTVPQDGEYALKLYCREKKINSQFKNVCNYLLAPPKKRGEFDGNARHRKVRRWMETAAIGDDESRLLYAVDMYDSFKDRYAPDKGEMAKAEKKLLFYRLKRNLQEATKRKHTEILQNCINDAEMSEVRGDLTPDIKRAKIVLHHLEKLKGFSHPVQELKPSTISEIRSYHHPEPIIHDIMKATCVVLGEDNNRVQAWSYIQRLLRNQGRTGFRRRITEFDPMLSPPFAFDLAEDYCSPYDLDMTHKASSGAATFYKWTSDMIKYKRKLQAQENREPTMLRETKKRVSRRMLPTVSDERQPPSENDKPDLDNKSHGDVEIRSSTRNSYNNHEDGRSSYEKNVHQNHVDKTSNGPMTNGNAREETPSENNEVNAQGDDSRELRWIQESRTPTPLKYTPAEKDDVSPLENDVSCRQRTSPDNNKTNGADRKPSTPNNAERSETESRQTNSSNSIQKATYSSGYPASNPSSTSIQHSDADYNRIAISGLGMHEDEGFSHDVIAPKQPGYLP